MTTDNSDIIKIAKLDKTTYSKAQRWNKFVGSGKSIKEIPYDSSWIIMFSNLFSNPKFATIEKEFKSIIQKDKRAKIYPLPEYLFSAFMMTPADKLKVVFIGQDPYFNVEYVNDTDNGNDKDTDSTSSENKTISIPVPQAMGLSFSVPHGTNIPSSLDNVFANMVKYGHLKKKPTTGNLWYWASQGCLMLNTALTVLNEVKKSHSRLWEWFTDYIIRYISTYMDNIIFVLWGSDAYEKIKLINLDKHHTIISSHPSGFSAHKPMKNYPAFMNNDHFGQINETLEKYGKTKILWN